MKLNDTLTYGLFLVGAIAVAGFFWYEKFVKQAESDAKEDLNRWVEAVIASKLASRVNASPDTIIRAFASNSNSSESALLKKISSLLRMVEVVFVQKSPSDVTQSLEAQLTDGTSFSLTNNVNWDDLPADVRSEFLKTGKKKVRVPWNPATSSMTSVL